VESSSQINYNSKGAAFTFPSNINEIREVFRRALDRVSSRTSFRGNIQLDRYLLRNGRSLLDQTAGERHPIEPGSIVMLSAIANS
jgi:hypothetical protein